MGEKKLSERLALEHQIISASYAEVHENDLRNALDYLITEPEDLAKYYAGSLQPPLQGKANGRPVDYHLTVYTLIRGNLVIYVGAAVPISQPWQEGEERLLSTTRCIWNDNTGEGQQTEQQIIRRLREMEYIRAHGESP